MDIIHVQGSGPLQGELKIQGSKNAVLPILAATVLIEGCCYIKNCPRISDVECMRGLLESIGCLVCWEKDGIKIDASQIKENRLPREKVVSMRSSIILLGPLLSRCKEASLDYPGGCVIGERPVDMHLYLLQRLGTEFVLEKDHIKGQVSELRGTGIHLPFPSVGATENGILASVLAKGTTTLYNCAKEPEIQQLCFFLNCAGAKIEGIGTDCLVIKGVDKLHPVSYRVCADRIVAGTYLFSVAAAGGNVFLLDAPGQDMESTLEVARKMGCNICIDRDGIEVRQSGRPQAIPYIKTAVYPGFPTDLQSALMAALAFSDGECVIEETIFSDRFHIVKELVRMGADIRIEGNCAIIKGKDRLHGASVLAEDLRGGAALILAGICAEGDSLIGNSHFIERGYEDICRDYQWLGAHMKKTGRNGFG